VAAFAVAVPDMPQEAEVMAAVVARAGAVIDASGLARFVNDHNPHYMVPRYIDVVDELPLTPTGKVQKYRLQQRGVTPSAWDRDASGFVLRR
jgi:crotonobetaine/carnitine-CoA ligase